MAKLVFANYREHDGRFVLTHVEADPGLARHRRRRPPDASNRRPMPARITSSWFPAAPTRWPGSGAIPRTGMWWAEVTLF